jgi:hypothetical protein
MMRHTLIAVVALLVAGVVGHAADRQWQMGTWAKPTIANRAGIPYRNYTIEADRFKLDLQETISKDRPALASAPDTPVTFAVENDMVYVRDGGAERALRLIKRSEKLKSYSAAGGGHYIKTLADGGLTLTLEDNSVWEIDPRGQYKSSAWQALQGISVRPVAENGGFNYEIGNTDTDEGVLGRLSR